MTALDQKIEGRIFFLVLSSSHLFTAYILVRRCMLIKKTENRMLKKAVQQGRSE